MAYTFESKMTPSAKLNALVASTTVFMMFWLVAYAAPALSAAGVGNPVLLSVGALIASTGVYRLLTLGIRWLTERCDFIRSKVLGAHYLHGTWVGYFKGHAGDKRYMVEHFVQDLDNLEIIGRSYTDAKTVHGYWTSESVTIDAKKGRLIFTYLFDAITQSVVLEGIHTSIFQRKSANDPPTAISGLAHDLNDPMRIAVHSEKASEKLLPWDEALEEAIRRHRDK